MPVGLATLAIAATGGGVALAQTSAPTAAPVVPAAVPAVHAKFTRDQLAGRPVRAHGRVTPAGGEHTVLLQIRRGRHWRTVDRVRTKAGRFNASWRPRKLGRYRLRVVLRGEITAQDSRKPHGSVRVYRLTLASWYGPGFYGGRTACGHTLTAAKLGVANKSLRCGTKVTLRYRGHRVTVPVIDRGPYAGARTWDLTPATKARLHFPSTGALWSSR